MIAAIVVWALKHLSLSEKDRLVLLTGVMHSINTVPLHAIITVDENRHILVQGKPLNVDQLLTLQESAVSVLNSQARNLIHEQVRFAAIDQGFLKSDDPKTQLFYKAALWFAQEETTLLKQLAGASDPTR